MSFYAPNRTVTLTVAASDSSDKSKAQADYICDGTADEVEINSAIDVANALPGGCRVQLFDGTYTVSSNVVVKANVALEGWGYASHIKLANSATLSSAGIVRVKFTTRANFAAVRNLRIDGNKANNGTTTNKYGIYAEADYLVIEGCYVHDCPAYGIDPHEDSGTPSQYLRIANNHVYDNGNSSFDNITLDQVRYSVVTGNVVRGAGRHGINVVTTSNENVISNNVVYSNGSAGIILQTASTNCVVTNNIVHTNAAEGIYMRQGDNSTIVGNRVYNNATMGIRLRGADGCLVVGNNLIGNCTSGGTNDEIRIDSESTTHSNNNLVSGNRISTTSARYGINEANSSQTNNIIMNNWVSGAVTANHNLGGANSTYGVPSTSDGTYRFYNTVVLDDDSGASPSTQYVNANNNSAEVYLGSNDITRMDSPSSIEFTSKGSTEVTNKYYVSSSSNRPASVIMQIFGTGTGSENLELTHNGSLSRVKSTVGNLQLDAPASSAIVMNENGTDTDTRIEGDTNANLFFVDASTDRIGIGTNSPGALLDLYSSSKTTFRMWGTGDGGAYGELSIRSDEATDKTWFIAHRADEANYLNFIYTPNDSNYYAPFKIKPVAYDEGLVFDTASIVFNEGGSATIDVRIEGDSDANLLFTDASADNVGIGTASPGSKLDVAGSFQCNSITNDTGLAAGVYTPTRSAEANLDANVTMTEAQYMRVGNTVTVSGRFTADPTLTATTTSFEITLPVASNIGAAEDAAGVAFCGNIAGQGAEVIGVVANDTAKVQWKASDITSQIWSYTFTYQVI